MTKTRRGIRGFLALLLGALVGLGGGIYLMLYVSAEKEVPPEQVNIIETEDVQEKATLTVENVREVVMPAGELTTTKYYYTDADVYKNYKEAFGVKIPFTTDEVVFTYDGVISVGIDILDVRYEVDNEALCIAVILPEVRIMSNEIDASSFEYPYVFDSVFNATNMKDYTVLIDELKELKAEEIMANTDFLNQARENTKTVIREFLSIGELTREYTVEFR